MGQRKISEGICVIPKDKIYFDIEDLYITPEFRNRGIGKVLFKYVEEYLKHKHIDYLLLSTATKDHLKIQNFYTQKMGMTVWTTTLFKNING